MAGSSDRSTPADELGVLLQTVFGFARFRKGQEAVCRAAIAGRDLLLVMPTGAGKSLCYQLPALARGGTALVISPLIALMEDQASKLEALGLRVARIHSGLERGVARQACSDYLRGELQFLFIAPERLRVPGFVEMLAKRRLALIAIDEAHCISQWGHDFRPDYRMLGEHLPRLRSGGEGASGAIEAAEKGLPPHEDREKVPAGAKARTHLTDSIGPTEVGPLLQSCPVIALTATATPAVQADILAQLGMVKPERFIHGFRRENLAIEVVEVPVPERGEAIRGLLGAAERRPAIVYATSRKQAERLAEELAETAGIRAAAYHAGLEPETRERVQKAFQAGELEVVVATIAFGMGIDKADIRTVIHAGLPGTLEGFYQEIGRAGRDGKESRTYLMHSYADQRTHDFFLNRDYPPTADLNAVCRLLSDEPQTVDELRTRTRMEEEAFDKALEKLEIHGGARVDFGGNVTAGGPGWKKTYGVQAQFRAEQFAQMLRFTEARTCRMGALVRHFGDEADAALKCGKCDVCDPAGAVLKQFRRATAAERGMAAGIVGELRTATYKATGTLQRSLDPTGRMSRGEFDGLLDAMVRADLIRLEDAEYEKDGEVRRYRKAMLTDAGLERRPAERVELLIPDGVTEGFGKRGEVKGAKKKAEEKRAKTADVAGPLSAGDAELAARLRAWRAAEAKRLGVPTFMVLHERTLEAVAATRPGTPRELLGVKGMGEAKVEKFGAAILGICGAGLAK